MANKFTLPHIRNNNSGLAASFPQPSYGQPPPGITIPGNRPSHPRVSRLTSSSSTGNLPTYKHDRNSIGGKYCIFLGILRYRIIDVLFIVT